MVLQTHIKNYRKLQNHSRPLDHIINLRLL